MYSLDKPPWNRQTTTLVWLAVAQSLAATAIGFAPIFFDHRAPDHVLFPGFFMGLAFAVVSLLAAWLALGPLPAIIRWPGALGGVTLMGAALVLLFVQGVGAPVAEIILVFGSAVIMQFLSSQIPLWWLRLRFGIQLRVSAHGNRLAGPGETQFSIRHLLIATAVVAALLGIARPLVVSALEREPAPWKPFLIFAVFAAFNAVVLWSALVAAVSKVSWKLAFPFFLGVLAPLTWLEFQAFYAIEQPGAMRSDAIVMLLVMNYVQFSWLFCSLLALRWAGYRLGTR